MYTIINSQVNEYMLLIIKNKFEPRFGYLFGSVVDFSIMCKESDPDSNHGAGKNVPLYTVIEGTF